MKLRFDLQKPIILPGGASFRYVDGELEPATGIVWLDEFQGASAISPGRRVRPGMGVHLASRTAVQKLEVLFPPEAAKAKKTDTKAA